MSSPCHPGLVPGPHETPLFPRISHFLHLIFPKILYRLQTNKPPQKSLDMKNLFLELSFAALCAALLSACGSESGTNSEPLEISSNSSSESFDEYDGEVEFFDDLPRCTGKKDGKVYYVEDEDITYTCRYDEDEEAGEWINASEGSDGSSSSDETDEGKSSASEEPDSSASEEPESSDSEGVEGSSASVSGEMVSCDIPGVMGECMEYPVGSDEAAQLTEFCVSMLGGTLGTGCAASTRDASSSLNSCSLMSIFVTIPPVRHPL